MNLVDLHRLCSEDADVCVCFEGGSYFVEGMEIVNRCFGLSLSSSFFVPNISPKNLNIDAE